MKIKEMKRRDWRRITRRDDAIRIVEKDGKREAEGILCIKQVTEPLFVQSGTERINIADAGYTWVQIAREDAPVWLTSMFNAEDRLVQVYFDITAGNRFDNPENPTFRDMYLDVVLTPAGEFFVLDQDELDDALTLGEITRAEYDRAWEVCDGLCAWLGEHCFEIMRRCEDVLHALRPLLNGQS